MEKDSSKSLIPYIYSINEQTFNIIKLNNWAQVISELHKWQTVKKSLISF